MDPFEEEGAGGVVPRQVTGRQASLLKVIRDLEPGLRHTLEIECRGTEPWKITKVKEHMDIQLKDGAVKKSG